jgi:hypothetical protein
MDGFVMFAGNWDHCSVAFIVEIRKWKVEFDPLAELFVDPTC